MSVIILYHIMLHLKLRNYNEIKVRMKNLVLLNLSFSESRNMRTNGKNLQLDFILAGQEKRRENYASSSKFSVIIF